jgi:hypothetical protein
VDVPGVDHVAIYRHGNDHPFRAVQFVKRTDPPFGDGDATWYDERDRYITSEEYREAIKANTWIPIEDIRLNALPMVVGTI